MHIPGSGAAEFREFWIQGVPEKIRAKVWTKVSGNSNFITKNLFNILVRKGTKLKAELDRKQAEMDRVSSQVESKIDGDSVIMNSALDIEVIKTI